MTTLDARTRTNLRDDRRIDFPQPPALPADRAHAPATSLIEAVRAAVRAIPSRSYQPVSSQGAGVAFQAPALVALLGFYYASGIYGSEEIEDAMRRDANFRAMCGGEFPDARLLRRFRRHNRDALEHCLAGILRFMAERDGKTLSDADLQMEVHHRLTIAIMMDIDPL